MSVVYYQELKEYYKSLKSELNPMDLRLAKEHLAVERLALKHSFIQIELPEGDLLPPRMFRLHLEIPSITRIQEDKSPIFGDQHTLEIRIPANYPVEAPVCQMTTDVWHPNIQSEEGPMKGRICGNTEGFGAFYSLDRLVSRICNMLRYKVYLADFRFPYPEDETVARWVKRYAEPRGIVQKGVGILPQKAAEVPVEKVSERKKVG